MSAEDFRELLASPEWSKEGYVNDPFGDEEIVVHNGKEEVQ